MSATFDTIPGRHPRLPVWAAHFRRHGWRLSVIAALFDVEMQELIDAGIQP